MHGGFTEAARRMFVSQPSVTAAMRDLEREASISVFERTSEGMVAAMEGQTFPGYTRQAIEQADLPQDQVHEAIEDVADRPAKGFAFGGPEAQRALLENEGVTFLANGRVDLAACRWHAGIE